jgi:hypothetical protein
MKSLKGAMDASDAKGRIGTLAFDAMSLTQALRYEESKDRIVGFEEVGGPSNRSHRVADHGFVSMCRTISSKTKMPMGFDLIKNNVSRGNLNKIVHSYLEAAHKTGMRIVSLTCDQEPTQWAWLKSAGVSPSNPFILHPCTADKVFVVPDQSHLLKNTRNCLKRYDIEFEPQKIAEWKWFAALCHFELESELQLCPTLKRSHVDLPIGQKMKVSIAGQTLSHSSAAAIRCYVKLGKMHSRALDTAEFFDRMTNCFDLVNSFSAFAKNPNKKAVNRSNLTQRLILLKNNAMWISQWKIRSRVTNLETKRHSFTEGWCLALNSLEFGSINRLID